MSAADLDDVLEFLRLDFESVAELGQSGNERPVNLGNRGNVHRSRETKLLVNARLPLLKYGGHIRVVTALAHVDVVIGVDGLLGAKLAAEDLDGAVRDDLYTRLDTSIVCDYRNAPRSRSCLTAYRYQSGTRRGGSGRSASRR